MAKSKTYSVTNMADGQVTDDTRLYFAVMPDAFAIENGTVADPQNVTLAEKVFVQVRFRVGNDLDGSMANENSPWVQVSSSEYPTLSAGFLADLKKIFDKERTDLSLDPV